MAIHHYRNRLKGALGWSLVGITLAYVLVVAAAGAFFSIGNPHIDVVPPDLLQGQVQNKERKLAS